MKLNSCTHFMCAGCDKIGKVRDAHKAEVAYSVFDRDSQNAFYFRPYWVLLCGSCFRGKEAEKKK